MLFLVEATGFSMSANLGSAGGVLDIVNGLCHEICSVGDVTRHGPPPQLPLELTKQSCNSSHAIKRTLQERQFLA